MKLSDREWGEFKLDKICLYIKSGVSINENSRKNGLVPYVSATSLNNGISDFIKNINCGIDSNVISVNVNGSIGYSFFHKYNALFSSDCKKIKIKKYSDNEYVSLFVCNQIMQQKNKYCYGYKMGKRLAKQIILLPITPQGEPDYEFMEEYIKEIINKKRQKYTEYVKDKMKSLKVVGGGGLENKNWIEFNIGELFNIIRVNGLPIENYKIGSVPYISTSSINNGLVSFVVSDIKSISNKNTISIDPIKGKVFYHKYNFVGRGFSGASINLLYSNNINENIALFLCTIIENTASKKSSYGYLFNSDRLKKCRILLPATQQNQPDYKFMENYIKNKMSLKYNKYLEYIKNK